jgi:hypothetical protein
MTRISTMFAILLLPGVAAAHPNHLSGGDYGLLHFVTDPFHVGMTAAAVLLFLVARRSLTRRRALNRRNQ